ncbi:MAG TPA: peptide chain release factor N(5)-glutamine methyltransferase [Terriglobia bacterium]|nr:peptide chain release factor N(5)-glutamine methyltransferase [Terriglobia bacterium]
MTLRDALLQGARRLETSGVANPRLNAETLLAHTLGVDRAYLYAHDDRELPHTQREAFETLLDTRASGVPTQYIVGHQEFFGRHFIVSPAVLIPRPETELLIETALDILPPESRAAVLDIGAGSGAIGVTLALERPQARIFATDVSAAALSVARDNAARLGAHVSLALMDLGAGIGGAAVFDLVVSNPPYISRGDAATLQREVRDHEPSVALFAGEDGLDVIRRLIPEAARLLSPGGWLLFEIGAGMRESVKALFDQRWETPQFRADLQGIPRTTVVRRA